MTIGWIDKEGIDNVWERVTPMLEKALEYNQEKKLLRHVYDDLRSGRSLLLFQDNFINMCIVQVDFPVVTLELFNGKLFEEEELTKEWSDTLDNLTKELGCKTLRILGRPGWTKRLKQYGYKHKYTIVEKEV